MMMTAILSMQSRIPMQLISRNTSLPVNSGKIVAVTGIRRGGKSFSLCGIIHRLLLKDMAKEKVLFINIDDECLQFNPQELDLIPKACRALYPEISKAENCFFFDEIQVAPGCKSLVYLRQGTPNKKKFLTDLNAKLPDSEMASSLRGSKLKYKNFPLCFDEYCRFTNMETNWPIPGNKALIENGFSGFMSQGELPGHQLSEYGKIENIIHEHWNGLIHKLNFLK